MIEDEKAAKGGANEDTSGEDEKQTLWEELPITMDKRIDLAVSVFIILFGVFVLIEAHGMRPGTLRDPVTSRGLPNIMGVILVVGGAVLMLRQLLNWSKLPGHLVPEEGQEDEKGYPFSAARAIGIILLSFLWGWLLRPLGFLIVTPLTMCAASMVMGVRSWRNTILFSILFSVAMWVVFGVYLNIRYPLGPLEHLARSLRLIL